MTPLHQKKGRTAQDENTLQRCQKKTGSYTIETGWGVCENLFVLSYVCDYEFGSFSSIISTVINKIIYFNTHTTFDGQIDCLFQDNYV